MPQDYAAIRANYLRLHNETGQRQRELAATLGIQEGELLAAHTGSLSTRLTTDWPALFNALGTLGEVMALTRNHACVHEKTGVYRPVRQEGSVGLVLGREIDLRVFYRQWAQGFAMEQNTARARRTSLQFFDAHGVAVHKIFLRPQSNASAYTALVRDFASPDQTPGWTPVAARAPTVALPDHAIDVEGLCAGWRALRDTHDFFALLHRFSVTRLQGLRLAGPEFARPVTLDSVERLLESAAASQLPIMVFTGNAGMLQIHSGPIRHLAYAGPWINILDPGFSLHLRRDLVTSAWVVRKPTDDGVVSSLELFDAEGESLVWFFGARKPGVPEQQAWRDLLATLETGRTQTDASEPVETP